MNPISWPKDTVAEMFAKAETLGKAVAELPSRRAAELFRFSMYHYRRNNEKVGKNVTIIVENNKVIAINNPPPEIKVN
jgi:hypothetical protein